MVLTQKMVAKIADKLQADKATIHAEAGHLIFHLSMGQSFVR
jgi:hypothetical protein